MSGEIGDVPQPAASGLRFGWVAGAEVFGRSSRLRAVCDELGLTGVFIVPSTFTITTPAATTTMTAAQAGVDAVFERRRAGRAPRAPACSTGRWWPPPIPARS